MERDYANDYDAWLAETGGDTGYGNTIPTEPPNPYWPPPSAPPVVPPVTPTATTTPSGKTPQQIEAEGREYDRRNGLIGGYMMNGVWVNGSPSSTTGGYEPTGGYAAPSIGATSAYDSSNFNWPSYAAPSFVDPGTFDPGPAFSYPEFSYRDFSAPTGDDVLKDPGFQFRLDQGRKALEASAAGKGILRSGGTMKDLLGYGQNFASQEYGNVYNRALSEYDTNRNNAFGTWDANRNNAADAWTKQYGQRSDVYGSNVNRANSLNSFNVNNSQFDFNGRQRQAEQEFQDLYNRWAKEGDWTRDLATFNPL